MPYARRTYRKRRSYRPRRSYSTYYRKRRTYRRKSRYTKKIIPMNIPSQMFTKLRFNETYTMSIDDETQLIRRYRLNSIYDPVYDVGGGSCTGLNQLATLYTTYTVHGAKVKIEAVNQGTDVAIFGMIGTNTETDDLSTTSFLDLLTEYKGGYRKILKSIPSGTDHEKFVMKKYFSIKKLEGLRSLTEGFTKYSSAFNTNPTGTCVLHVGLSVPGTSFVTSQVTYTITITYYVRSFGVNHDAISDP